MEDEEESEQDDFTVKVDWLSLIYKDNSDVIDNRHNHGGGRDGNSRQSHMFRKAQDYQCLAMFIRFIFGSLLFGSLNCHFYSGALGH